MRGGGEEEISLTSQPSACHSHQTHHQEWPDHTLSDRRLSPLLTCPPHVPLVNKSVVHSALCSTLNSCSTLNDLPKRKFLKADRNRLQSSQFTSFFLFSLSLSLPSFLKPLFLLSPSLFLCLDWASSFLLLHCLDSPNRSGPFYSLCLNPLIFRDVHRRLQNARTWCTKP